MFGVVIYHVFILSCVIVMGLCCSTPRVSDCTTTREIADATLEHFTMHCAHALTCYELAIEFIETAIAIVDFVDDIVVVVE